MTDQPRLEGRCTCGEVRFRMNAEPMIVHACHCSECQRLTGSAFALNALIESEQVEMLAGEPEPVPVAGTSGKVQTIFRCPRCKAALWSHYPGMGAKVSFVRVGTLDEPGRLAPDIHIFTSTRLPWLELPAGTPAVPEFYSPKEVWSAATQERWQRLKES